MYKGGAGSQDESQRFGKPTHCYITSGVGRVVSSSVWTVPYVEENGLKVSEREDSVPVCGNFDIS